MLNVIVTGGSRGLGLGIAARLSKSGYNVIAIARKPTNELGAAIRQTNGGEAGSLHFVPFDLADVAAIPAMVTGLRKKFGAVYGLVNNAGIGTSGLLATMHNTQIEALVRLNTLSPIILTKYVVRSMMADRKGRVINVASIVGFTGYSGLSVYSTTKAGLIGFTKSLAREVGQRGVNVNAIAPGFMDTDMTHEMENGQRERVKRRSALRRLAEVDDVASSVEFLLGDGARNITGTVLTVDAGSTA
jgi:3-oxoacyl-[acyl-carrier protein] reductase